ncbi:hypothetical protein J2W51_003385 [Tardiphaga robiniae]|uniref:hypothetical protein n=1 Tax=Tardiphaga robiniae TaxID=943830 RepID=UPI00286641D6|nr:hypothetical protein [Tardiphaga robiniae]MDR6660815.1 hypothetical protein [Tardiphaga robiniae]
MAYEFSGAGPGQAAQRRPVEEDQPPAELLGPDVADRHAAPEATLAGIKVVEAWGGYSTTIGNLWFDLPDACASAAEIARRGPLPAEVVGLIEVHRGLKAAFELGARKGDGFSIFQDEGGAFPAN